MNNDDLKFTDEAVRLVEVIGDRRYSETQALKALLIEKNGKRYVVIQKWWRKSPDEPWIEGKGFHLSPEEAEGIRDLLEKGIVSLKELENSKEEA